MPGILHSEGGGNVKEFAKGKEHQVIQVGEQEIALTEVKTFIETAVYVSTYGGVRGCQRESPPTRLSQFETIFLASLIIVSAFFFPSFIISPAFSLPAS